MRSLIIICLLLVSFCTASQKDTFSKKTVENFLQDTKQPHTVKSCDSVKNLKKGAVSLDFIKCIANTDAIHPRYTKAAIYDFKKEADQFVIVYQLFCNAGGYCISYFVSVLKNDEVVLHQHLIDEYSEGEFAIFINRFQMKDQQLKFEITEERYDEMQDDYVATPKEVVFEILENRIQKISN